MDTKTKEFIQKAKMVHGNRYDYSKTVYVGSIQPVTIECLVHGKFKIRPNNHLSSKQGCQKCSNRHRPSLVEFIQQSNAIHNNKYRYSNVIYVNNKTKVEITCPAHGAFLTTPRDHLHNKSGCPSCARSKRGAYHKRDTKWFIEAAIKIHGDKYDYSKVQYVRYHDKVEVVCPTHGPFFQTAGGHISQSHGCPTCSYQDYEGGYGEQRFRNHPEIKNKPAILYLIKCLGDSEQFLKIGITQHTLDHRFKNTNRLPYKYEIVTELQGTLYEMFLLEQKLKKQFKQYKYRPVKKFNGHTECLGVECANKVQNVMLKR